VPNDAARCLSGRRVRWLSSGCIAWCRVVPALGRVLGTQMPGSVGVVQGRERVVVMTAMAATTSGLRPVGATDLSTDETTGEEQVQGLSRGQTAAVVLSFGLGVVVAGYGLAGSYVAVSELAGLHGVPLTRWVPAGLDGGLVAVVVLDLVLTWIGAPVGWLRQLVRVLSAGTVVANAIAGWPDPVALVSMPRRR
jgi:uncharacterized protein DUF2637